MLMKKYGNKRYGRSSFLLVWMLFMLPFLLSAKGVDRSRYYEQLTGNLIQQIKAMQDENARLVENVNILTNKVMTLEKEYKRVSGENRTMKQNQSAGLEALRSRNQYLENKIYNLERKIQKLEHLIRDVGNVATQSEAKPPKTKYPAIENPVPAGKDVEYVEHTVEKGHVLFNIAKAYRVKVQDIRRINHLKSDRLSIGQKLLIPVKKER